MEKFSVPFGDIEIVGDRTLSGEKCSILMMHGAGGSQRSRYEQFRSKLADDGISTIAFDFIGHGETGGELIGSNLLERTKQASVVIEHQKMNQPLTLFGSSMSGYTAIKLTEHFNVGTLILNVPAMYATNAYEIPFGKEFSGKIRKDNGWRETDALKILENYSGQLLMIVAENDDVVPREITDEIFKSTKNTSRLEQLIVKNAPHKIILYAKKHPEVFEEVYSAIKRFI